MTVSLLPTMFIGHHFAQPRGQAERSREALNGDASRRRSEQLLLRKYSK